MSALQNREESYAEVIAHTVRAVELIESGLEEDATEEQRERAKRVLAGLRSGVIGLVTASLNASTAMQMLADELDRQ